MSRVFLPSVCGIPTSFWGLAEPTPTQPPTHKPALRRPVRVSWSLIFACVIIVTVILKYAIPRRERCPQCTTVRDPEHPLCAECGWIYEVPGEEDDDYGEPERVEPWN